MKRQLTTFLGSLAFLLSILILIWAKTPLKYEAYELILSSEALPLKEDESSGLPFSEKHPLSQRKIKIEVPQFVRLGEKAAVRIVIEPGDGNVIDKELDNSDYTENPGTDKSYFLESRLDIYSAGVQPSGNIRENLAPGKRVTFYWLVQPKQDGHFEGTLWLYDVSMMAKNESAQRMAVLAKPVQFECYSIFNLPTYVLFWLAVATLSLIIGRTIYIVLVKYRVQKKL